MTFASHERTGKGAVDAASSAALRVRVLVTLVAFMTLVAGGEHTLVAADVVVSEIHYHPLASEGEIEFIELENTTSRAIDLSGWAFTEGIAYEFPEGTVIEPHGLIVLCRDPDTLARSFGLDPSALHWWFGASLDNGGERLVLVDLEGRIVEEVEYDDDAPWDRDADGFGPSLERVCLEAPADLPNNWVADIERRPTPL
ncbi:MAG TPA: lamin tail domain-containing protein, partial [Planctomycetota bacterium]|nr:lamin tail domain-containing protein [Planctomycetota bacterium]